MLYYSCFRTFSTYCFFQELLDAVFVTQPTESALTERNSEVLAQNTENNVLASSFFVLLPLSALPYYISKSASLHPNSILYGSDVFAQQTQTSVLEHL